MENKNYHLLQMLEMTKMLLKERISRIIDINIALKNIKHKEIQYNNFRFKNFNLFSFLHKSYHKSRRGANGMHIYHILKPSKWPAFMSIVLFALAINFIFWLMPESNYYYSKYTLYILFISFLTIFYFWFFDIFNEAGEHNQTIRQGIKIGMILFIMSEFMFFFAFFWAYLHSSTNPSTYIGHCWPPYGQLDLLINSISLPLLNTLLLLTSGFSVTLAHKFANTLFIINESIINLNFTRIFSLYNRTKNFILFISLKTFFFLLFSFNYIKHTLRIGLSIALIVTITLAIVFTNIQYSEYVEASFNLTDGVYASCFYLMTGFHGIHVIVGTIFLTVCLLQIKNAHDFYKESTGLECAIWYWHFVDVIWLFLYVIVYLIADNAYQHEARTSLFERITQHEKIFNIFTHGCHSPQIKGFAVKNQLYFNAPASTTMSEIVWLHDYIMFFIIIIFFIVVTLMYGILRESTIVPLYEYYLKFIDKRNNLSVKGNFYQSDYGRGFSTKKAKDEVFFIDEAAETRSKGY